MKKLITFISILTLVLLFTSSTFANSDCECQTCTLQNCTSLVSECSKLYGCPHTVACIGVCSRLLVSDGVDWTPESNKAYYACCDNCAWKHFPLQSRIKAAETLICQIQSCNKQCS